MKITAFIILLLASAFSHADEKVDYYGFSDAFAECAALQNTLARMVTSTEEEYSEHYLHQVANGAIVVSEDFASAGGYKRELAISLYDSSYSKFQSMLNADPKSFISNVKPILDECAVLNELQTELITEMRKQMYKAE